MRTAIYLAPHIAILIFGIALWELCAADSPADLSLTRVFALIAVGIGVALIGYGADPE